MIDFKKKIFGHYVAYSKVTKYDQYTDKYGVNHQETYELYVTANQYLKKIDTQFSQGVTRKILERLDTLGLAIWYADDGTTVLIGKNEKTGGSKRRRFQICTDRYSEKEVDVIIEYFRNVYGYNVSKKRRRDNEFRVQINGKDAQKFLKMIYPYFEEYFPSLLYKMDLGYRGSSLENEAYVLPSYKDLFSKMQNYWMQIHPLFVDRMKDR